MTIADPRVWRSRIPTAWYLALIWDQRTTEKQKDRRCPELESTQTIIVVLEWLRKLDFATRFCCNAVLVGSTVGSIAQPF